MSNPILGELVAREQYKDHLREAEQIRRINAVAGRQQADRSDLRIFLSNLMTPLRYTVKVLAHLLGVL